MRYWPLMLIPLLFGCAMANSLNHVSLGMDKKQVITAMGDPDSTSAQSGAEYLIYWLHVDNTPGSLKAPYYVRLKDGRVDSYGRNGDFDSTKPVEFKSDVTVHQ